MGKYLVGTDRTGGAGDCVDKVAEIIKKAGHDVENLGVNPNMEGTFASKCKSDDVVVFIINGACLATWHSYYDDLIKPGKCSQVVFCFPFNIMSHLFNTKESLTDESKKLRCVNESWVPAHYHNDDGKWTVDEAFKQYDKVDYVYGDNCADVAQAILDGNFGGTGDGGDDEEGSDSTSSEGESKPMSGWESLCDLIKPYDGQIFMTVRGDTVIVKKIEIPEWTAIWAYEGINVVDDSVTVTDYSPEIYNTIEVKYGANFENTITLCFERHKELFGERTTTIFATKKVSEEEYQQYEESLKQQDEEDTTQPKGEIEKPQNEPQYLQQPVQDTHSTSTSGNYPNPINPFTPNSPVTMQTSTTIGDGSGGGGGNTMNANYVDATQREKINIQRRQQQDNINQNIINTAKKGKVVVKKYYKDKTS